MPTRNIHRLLKAVTGYEHGDGDFQLYEGFANDPDNLQPVVIGDWNRRAPYSTPEDQLTKADLLPPRLREALENAGAVTEWIDEFISCDECGLLIRTEPDSYGFIPEYTVTEYGYTCNDCAEQYPNDYLQPNDPRIATTLSHETLLQAGYELHAPDEPDYAAGLATYATDDPETILQVIHDEHPTADVVFRITDNGQFHVNFTAYVRHNEED